MRTETVRRHDSPPRERQLDTLAEVLHKIVLRFQTIKDDLAMDNARLREEWRDARGLAAWTEERIESLEERIAAVERASSIGPSARAAWLAAVVANYEFVAQDLRGNPLPDPVAPEPESPILRPGGRDGTC